ncbi:tRNA lysidine(34) synthetase TilS [Bacillus sp. 2205SS5-2]|uniref:tRNA lysidine(34) synthetase TilS n=1 Tax=Bacillus sp. 2205SS5-2 TaxID=3109031 RepID=UPI003005E3D9
MLKVEQKISKFIQQHTLIEKGDIIVIGVSGGPDSLMLLHYFHSHQVKWGVKVVVVSVDHMLRGDESYEDILFVESFCQQRNIPYLAKRVDVGRALAENKIGLQENARNLRYQAFREAIQKWNATKLALGHHGDDQIETVLMTLTRGSSTQSIGIPIKREFAGVQLIRPLLSSSKKEIEKYCEHYSLQPRLDPSNAKKEYTRNRFRQQILPFIKKENHLAHDHFQRFSQEHAEDDQYMLGLAQKMISDIWDVNEEGISIPIPSFLQMPQPLQRRGIHLILSYLYKQKPSSLSAVHIYGVLSLMNSKHPSGRLQLPSGLLVKRSYETCFFHFDKENEEDPFFHHVLSVGESLTLGEDTVFSLVEEDQLNDHTVGIIVDREEILLPLHVRTRQPGDRIKVKGLNGSKKVKDIFIDEKIPLNERKTWPIITDHKGTVLWIPFLRVSVYAKSREDQLCTSRVLTLKKESASRGQAKI